MRPITHHFETSRRLRGHFEMWPKYILYIDYQYINDQIHIITAELHSRNNYGWLIVGRELHPLIARQYGDELRAQALSDFEQLKNEADNG